MGALACARALVSFGRAVVGVVLGVAEAAIIMANKATRMKSAGF